MEAQKLDARLCYHALRTRDARFDGRFFTAVLTTGIFCRPTCPAQTPKFENCTFYRSAAAAHAAGYRPCLRCRPEVAPGLAGWRGTANTVKRALHLIHEGALDDGNVETLAARVGVGSRHLRRLFDEHVGTSPFDVAQTHRLLFAKKLLNETELTIADIALAAGFGSVRRFNTVVRNAYGRTPRELRGSKRTGDHRIRLRLSYKPPYDWEAMLGYLRARAIPGVEELQGETYRRTFDHGIVEVRHREAGFLEVAIELEDVSRMASLVARLRRLFDLDADVDVIGRHLSKHRSMSPLVVSRPGLRVPGAWDGFELAVRAILGQQITVAAARRLAGRLSERFGSPLPKESGTLTTVFPNPAVLARADIASIGMPRARAKAISSLAAMVASEPDFFLHADVERLKELPGIGEWTAQYIAMRALGDTDAFPATDVGLLRAMGRVEPEALRALSESWRPWRAYAAQHLWTKDAYDG